MRAETRQFPNGGRKVLLFSDGRQKAARLARDIPREVEQDIFRQVLAVAAARLVAAQREARPMAHLYIAVLTVLRDFNLPMFDRDDARRIEQEIEKLEKDHDGDSLGDLLSDFVPADSPPRYKVALLKQLCGRYYSLAGTSVGLLLPTRNAQRKLHTNLRAAVPALSEADVDDLAGAWISELADKFALDRDIPAPIRSLAMGHWSTTWGTDGRFERALRAQLPAMLGVSDATVSSIEGVLANELALQQDGAFFLDRDKVRIHIDLDAPWFQCRECTELMPFTIRQRCVSCASTAIERLDPSTSQYIRARKGFWREPVRAALGPAPRLRSIAVEEHTAQLSNRDNTRVHATTEKFELRFRDVQIESRDRPIDVLSCTTTMEVGVDIGSLVAVGLRNVPPQRENYQQRAGRAGRRGSSISTVLTYAQNGPHDSYYYSNPGAIVAGPPRNPDIKIDNPKIAQRHVASFLLQTFFHRYMDEHNIAIGGPTSALFKALGKARDFFFGDGQAGPSFAGFRQWVAQHVIAANGVQRQHIRSWLPPSLRTGERSLDEWIGDVASELIADLEAIMLDIQPPPQAAAENAAGDDDDEDDGTDDRNALGDEELLEFLFSQGLLPSYAFPTDLTSFLVERLGPPIAGRRRKMEIVERPQQGIAKALSEYAPGRLIVINKETYRSGGVVANTLPTVHNRAEPLFAEVQEIVHCDTCSFVRDPEDNQAPETNCPVCSGTLQRTRMVVPQVFLPEGGRALAEDDREQDITYTTGAQFPVPVGTNDVPGLRPAGAKLAFAVTTDRKLITANKGQLQNDTFQGFWICDKCGRAALEQPPAAPHDRPYLIEFAFGPPAPRHCNGVFHNVFLGHVFATDLLLLRMTLEPPMATDTNNSVVLRSLEDALYSIAEALRLAASRHPQLDLDPSEFGAGFRIVPSTEGSERLHLDVYLYDTLSGGAGWVSSCVFTRLAKGASPFVAWSMMVDRPVRTVFSRHTGQAEKWTPPPQSRPASGRNTRRKPSWFAGSWWSSRPLLMSSQAVTHRSAWSRCGSPSTSNSTSVRGAWCPSRKGPDGTCQRKSPCGPSVYQQPLAAWTAQLLARHEARMEAVEGLSAEHLELYAPDVLQGQRRTGRWIAAGQIGRALDGPRLCRPQDRYASSWDRPFYLAHFGFKDGALTLRRTAPVTHDLALRLRFGLDTVLQTPRRISIVRQRETFSVDRPLTLPQPEARVYALGWKQAVQEDSDRLTFHADAMPFVMQALQRLAVTPAISGGTG